jgi:hypothetical protein
MFFFNLTCKKMVSAFTTSEVHLGRLQVPTARRESHGTGAEALMASKLKVVTGPPTSVQFSCTLTSTSPPAGTATGKGLTMLKAGLLDLMALMVKGWSPWLRTTKKSLMGLPTQIAPTKRRPGLMLHTGAATETPWDGGD